MAGSMANTTAQMDDANRALCYAWRHPPAGVKKIPCETIAGMVVKTDGTHPSAEGVHVAAKQFKVEKEKRGRKKGDKKTSRAEDRAILKGFKIRISFKIFFFPHEETGMHSTSHHLKHNMHTI